MNEDFFGDETLKPSRRLAVPNPSPGFLSICAAQKRALQITFLIMPRNRKAFAERLIIWIHYRVNLNLLKLPPRTKLHFFRLAFVSLILFSVKLQIRLEHQFTVCTSFQLIKTRNNLILFSRRDRYELRANLSLSQFLIACFGGTLVIKPQIINKKHMGVGDKPSGSCFAENKELMSLSSGVRALLHKSTEKTTHPGTEFGCRE